MESPAIALPASEVLGSRVRLGFPQAMLISGGSGSFVIKVFSPPGFLYDSSLMKHLMTVCDLQT